MLELTRKQLQDAKINILKVLVKKIDSIYEQMGNFNRKLETFSQSQNTRTDTGNEKLFHWLYQQSVHSRG